MPTSHRVTSPQPTKLSAIIIMNSDCGLNQTNRLKSLRALPLSLALKVELVVIS